MKYIDLHCDSVTACFDGGYALTNGETHVNFEKLKKSRCAAQCFAIFTDGAGARESFENYTNFFLTSVRDNSLTLVDCYSRLISCVQSQNTGAILTVENLGFTDGDARKITALKDIGVLMASLVWNNENSLACPNGSAGGLKPNGRQTVSLLDDLKIIVDVSHLSDGGTDEILKNRKIPVVASHSNARAVCNVPRNLTDKQIRAIADCGGVIGANFHKKFLGVGEPFACVLGHIKHIINSGGEDAVAFGSDFDGIPTVDGLEGCEKMPALIEFLSDNLGDRITEKLCFENFARVLKDVRP